MGRNEIRIRRKSVSSGSLARYRNYESLMARHERDQRIRRLSRLIVYVLITVILICTLLGMYIIHEKKKFPPNKPVKEARLVSSFKFPVRYPFLDQIFES